MPKHGYRFAASVSEVTAEPAVEREPDAPSPVIPSLATSRYQKKFWYPVAGAALIIALVSYALGPGRTDSTTAREPTAAIPITAYPGIQKQPNLSPDGNQVAFAWNGMNEDNFDIYVKLAGPGEPVRITRDPAQEEQPVWSPDGRTIAFARYSSYLTGGIFTIPALGGSERKVTDTYKPAWPYINKMDLSWTPDGE